MTPVSEAFFILAMPISGLLSAAAVAGGAQTLWQYNRESLGEVRI